MLAVICVAQKATHVAALKTKVARQLAAALGPLVEVGELVALCAIGVAALADHQVVGGVGAACELELTAQAVVGGHVGARKRNEKVK